MVLVGCIDIDLGELLSRPVSEGLLNCLRKQQPPSVCLRKQQPPVDSVCLRVAGLQDTSHPRAQVYDEDLERHPANGYALLGRAQALAALGRADEAAAAAAEHAAAWRHADAPLACSCPMFAASAEPAQRWFGR